MKNTVISNTFLSLMCDFGEISLRDYSQHFFTAYVCSRFLTTSTADRNCRIFDGGINSTALFTAAPHAFRYVLLTTRFQKDYLREGPSCTFPIHKGYCGESVHYTGVSNLNDSWRVYAKPPNHKEPERSGLNSCLSSPRRAQTISAWYIIA